MRWLQLGRRPLYAGLFFTACLSAIYILCYQPLQREVAQQREITAGKQQELAEVEHFLQLHPDMNSFRGELDRKSAAISSMLPDQMEVGPFMAAIEQSALQSKVVVSSMTPGAVVSGSICAELPIEITVQGGYFDLLAFLQAVEALPRCVHVRKMQIEKQNTQLSCKLLLVIYADGEKIAEMQ